MMVEGDSASVDRFMRSRGIDANHGYRPFTRKNDAVTTTVYAKIREQDLPGLVAIITDGAFGKMPEDFQEAEDLRHYLSERYKGR